MMWWLRRRRLGGEVGRISEARKKVVLVRFGYERSLSRESWGR